MRKIPATMATQHPDNASASPFTGKRFISSQDEIEECFRCFSELGVQEFMWDWEGKFVDEAVIDRLYNLYHDYFKQNQIGKDIFLTFRVPNIWIESSHKLPRAFMNMISAENAAKTYKFHSPPLFEVILPMTTSASQLEYLQKTFGKTVKATGEIFDMKSDLKMLEVIPLFEEFESMADAKEILHTYTKFLKDEYDHVPEYMRLFIARSDPALNAGFLTAKLACKHAISAYHEFEDETGIEVHPWVGGGALPFRGGINPTNVEANIDEYRGAASLTVQSAFRYDYPMDQVKSAIAQYNEQLPKNLKKHVKITKDEGDAIKNLNRYAAGIYQKDIESIADVINIIAKKLPSHRERVQHIGLFGYSRGVGQVSLPRAIKFTGSLYSLGVPPELISTGRVLKKAEEMGIIELIDRICPQLRRDLNRAGHYLNRENLELLVDQNPTWKNVQEDLELIQKFLGHEIGPERAHHTIHRNFTSNIFHKLQLGQDFGNDVLQAAVIRKSLG
jgi:phosphoenolpyruvate carboxylase